MSLQEFGHRGCADRRYVELCIVVVEGELSNLGSRDRHHDVFCWMQFGLTTSELRSYVHNTDVNFSLTEYGD